MRKRRPRVLSPQITLHTGSLKSTFIHVKKNPQRIEKKCDTYFLKLQQLSQGREETLLPRGCGYHGEQSPDQGPNLRLRAGRRGPRRMKGVSSGTCPRFKKIKFLDKKLKKKKKALVSLPPALHPAPTLALWPPLAQPVQSCVFSSWLSESAPDRCPLLPGA